MFVACVSRRHKDLRWIRDVHLCLGALLATTWFAWIDTLRVQQLSDCCLVVIDWIGFLGRCPGIVLTEPLGCVYIMILAHDWHCVSSCVCLLQDRSEGIVLHCSCLWSGHIVASALSLIG